MRCRHCGMKIVLHHNTWIHTGPNKFYTCRINMRSVGGDGMKFHPNSMATPLLEEEIITKVLNKYEDED